MLKDRNSVYRNLQRFASGDSQDISAKQISDLIEDLIEEYERSSKTPKEMADAQHKLEETAEKVMKNMLVEKDVTSIDVRGMKLVMTQIQALGQMGEQSETSNIPILVEDKLAISYPQDRAWKRGERSGRCGTGYGRKRCCLCKFPL